MWIAIIYVCLSQGCGFIDSPPVHSQEECQAMLNGAAIQMMVEPDVKVFDGACIKIKMGQV